MSQIQTDPNGNLSLILENQTEATEQEMALIMPLEKKTAWLSSSELQFKEDIRKQEVKLMTSPDYMLLMKLREKLQVARKMKKETVIILNNEYRKIIKRTLPGDDLTDIYCDALPELPAKTGKRGRPKMLAGRA